MTSESESTTGDQPLGTITALSGLDTSLRRRRLLLDLGDVAGVRTVRDELVDQINDYLIPRLRRLDAPLLVVLGGSTGSGKSTITNSIVGAEVSPAGVLRPTTRAPVLICHPDDEAWFGGGEILPELPRVTGSSDTTGTVLRINPSEAVDPGLAIIDAPDIDSVEDANRDLAAQLLSAADMWLFTTTAVRYADAVPWDFLRQARDRGTALAVIINRIPTGASGEIVPHLSAMLTEAGLDGVPVYPIEQAELVEGRLPTGSVTDLRTMLADLAADAERRAEVVATTLNGAMDSIPDRVRRVIDAGQEQDDTVNGLRTTMEEVYAESRESLNRDINSGNLLRSEVLDRWQELIGTAELMQAIQSRISMIRDRVGAFLTGRTAATTEVQGEITSTLEQLLIDHADAAAANTAAGWRGMPGGKQVLAGGAGSDEGSTAGLERSSEAFRSTVGSEIRAWQDDILDLVRDRGAGKRTTARILAASVNTVGIALMVVLFAQTGGITGAEVAIGAGTAGLSQTLLSALFGEQAVRELAAEARSLLMQRMTALLESEADRFRTALDGVAMTEDGQADLPDALQTFERTR